MRLVIAPQARRQLAKLPKSIQKKAWRQFNFLLTDHRHPSLRTKKMGGRDSFEARIDIHYRFTFQIEGSDINVLTVGPHDVGLGKR